MDSLAGLRRGTLDRVRLSRDPRFDGKVFIAIKSTGVYCRPICPSPTSRPKNVVYYATAAAATEAGFRPCLRCRPEAAPGTPAWLGTSAVVARALRLIDDGFLDAASVDALAATVGVGPRHLHRLFVQHVGASPVIVAQTRRLQFAKRLLDQTDLRMAEIAAAAGFGSLRRFNDAFQRTYARTPRELRRRPVGAGGGGGAATTDADGVVLRLAYRPPYAWDDLLRFLATRAVPGVERADGGSYTRTVSAGSAHAIVTVRPIERAHALELRVRGASPRALFQISTAARRVFDLTADPARVASVLRADRRLRPLVGARPGLRIPGVWDPFEAAVRAILGQQVSVAAGRTLVGRVVARAGAPIATGPTGLTHLFPSAAALASADLGGLGLTGGRVAALNALARAVVDRTVDFDRPVAEVVDAIASLPGCGPWTAQYVALRGLGDPDAFPASDLVLRRAAGVDGPSWSASALAARADAWRPWRGYAALHLWRAVS